jgi:hypothetical protein
MIIAGLLLIIILFCSFYFDLLFNL